MHYFSFFFSFILTITPLYVQIIQIHGNDVHRPLLRIYNRNYNFLIKIFLRPFIRFRHRTEYGNKISSLMNIEPEKILVHTEVVGTKALFLHKRTDDHRNL